MSQGQVTSFAFDGLDRGVVLATVSGLIFNGVDASLLGVLLTLAAALTYALTRIRIANLDHFECVQDNYFATLCSPKSLTIFPTCWSR